MASHPSRVRGLKPLGEFDFDVVETVAPLTGAWIETASMMRFGTLLTSHPSRVRGLKHLHGVSVLFQRCRPPHGCVD